MDALQQLNIAAPVADVFGKIEYDIIMAIARQLSRNPEQLINHTSEWRIQMLARMGKVNRDTARYIAQQTAGVPGEIESIINETISAVLEEHGLAGNDKVIENIEKALTAFDHQAVKDKYNQVNTVMQYKAKKAYVNGVNSVADKFEKNEIVNKQEHLDILNKNALEVTLGEKSRTEAIRDTIREMSDKGIPAFVDASGREWSPEAYVNMDIRNTAKNAALMSEFECTKELGQDVILVSSHAAARPLCAPYQGKFYSLSGKAGTITDAYGKEYTYTPLSSTSYGEPAGLFGINCGHTFRGVEDGCFVNNEEQYDEKENSEEYDKVVKQRAMEREIRKNKMKRDALRAAGDDEGAREYDLRVKRDTKRMTEYCEQNDLAVRMDRTQVYGYTDPSLKQKKKDIVKTVDKSEESGIMESRKISSDKIDWLPKGENITSEQFKDLRSYATSKGFTITGFKKSDVDIELVKEGIEKAATVIEKFPELKGTDRKPLTLNLSYSMNANDFAETRPPVGHIIHMNGNAFRDKKKLSLEYQQLVDDKWFVQGTNYNSVIVHELGHLYQEVNNIADKEIVDIAINAASVSTRKELFDYLSANLSCYSALYDDGREIISEVFSDYFNCLKPKDFSVKFMNELLKKR